MTKNIETQIVWSKGRTKAELRKQTSWSSSKDWSGLSGLEIKAWTLTLMLVVLQLQVKAEVIINIFRFLLTRLKSSVML